MAAQLYMSRREPFVFQESSQSRKNQGFGIGSIVFVLLLLGLLLVSLYVIPPLMDTVNFPDIGISYTTIFLLIVSCIILVSLASISKGGTKINSGYGYKDRDPSICKKIVKDGYDGIDIIVTGPKDTTFAQACMTNWQFTSTSRKSRWYIRDEKGNDVSDRLLDSVDGVFILVPENVQNNPEKESDKYDEYSSIHQGVEFYD
jgi:hypothetical protein